MQMLRVLGESDIGLPVVSWSGQVPVVVRGSGEWPSNSAEQSNTTLIFPGFLGWYTP